MIAALFFGQMAFLSGSVPGAEPARSAKALPVPVRFRSVTSRSGRFLVVGVDSTENMAIANWAEKIREKIENVLGIRLLAGARQDVRITLAPPEKSAPFRVRAGHEAQRGKWVHFIAVEGNDKVDYEDLQGALCYLLLSRHVFLGAKVLPGKERGPVDLRKEGRLARFRLPYWFVEGISQNLAGDLRAKNNEVVYKNWRGGQVEPIGHFLDGLVHKMAIHEDAGGAEDVPEEAALRAMSGMLMSWLMSLPGKDVRIRKMMERAKAGEAMTPEWLVTLVPGCETVGDLDEQWDRWIVHQRSVVVRPGQVTPRAIDRVRAELLLYTGDSGIPLSGRVNQVVGWSELITRRREDWIPVFAQSKGVALHLAAVGRGDRVGEVVNAYRKFLDALGRRKSERKLKKLLAAARKVLKAFAVWSMPSGQTQAFEVMGPPRPALILIPRPGFVGPPRRGSDSRTSKGDTD